MPDAAFFLLIREKKRSAYLTAKQDWTERESAAHALSFLNALNESYGPKTEIEDVLAAVAELPASPEETVQLAIWRAHWSAYVDGDLPRAYELLATVGTAAENDATAPRTFSGLLLAARLRLDIDFGYRDADTVPLVEAVPDAPDHASELLPVLNEFWQYRGDAANSRAVVDRLGADLSSSERSFFAARSLIGEGDLTRGLDEISAVFATAVQELDTPMIRRSALLFASLLVMQGRFRVLGRVQEIVEGLGNGPWFPATEIDNVRGFHAIGLARTGKSRDARAVLDTELLTPLSPPGDEVNGLLEAHLLLVAGREVEAGNQLWALGLAQFERGDRLFGTFSMLASIDFSPNEERLAAVRTQVEAVDSALAQSILKYLVGREEQNIQELLDAAEAMMPAMTTRQIVSAFRSALAIAEEQGDEERVDDISVRFEDFLEIAANSGFDIDVLEFPGSRLTARETEIAQLVSDGRTNTQIAEELTLSVRTVANYLNRIKRKTNARSREQLVRYLSNHAR